MKANYLNLTPSARKPLTAFDMSHTVRTSLKPGMICPVELREVLPGDVWDDKTYTMTRLTSNFIRPIADDIYLDLYHFFVPLRLCFKKIEGVFNVQEGYYYSTGTTLSIPTIPAGLTKKGSVADYLGCYGDFDSTTNVNNIAGGYSVLPFRAFALIYDYWFRNEQVEQPMKVYDDAINTTYEKFNRNAWSNTNYTGMPPVANRYKDMFSSSMLRPQRGEDVNLSLDGMSAFLRGLEVNSNTKAVYSTGATEEEPSVEFFDTVGGISIAELRTAEALQKYLERGNIYGVRYREYLNSAYGVNIPELQVQQPEFLGSSHTRLNVQQVASTSESEAYPVGQVAAMSQTFSSKDARWRKSFNEHGYIITCAMIRYKHTYSQGVSKLWTRTKREHFYDPLFAHLAYEPIRRYQVFAPISGTLNDTTSQTIIGYNEAFIENRVPFDRVSAEMRPEGENLGSYYSLADVFDDAPMLADLVKEDTESFDRVLGIDQATLDPFLVDLSFVTTVYSVLTPYGDPR